MKHIFLAILFAAFAGSIASADDIDFTGEWIVENDDAGESGITVAINENLPPSSTSERVLRDHLGNPYIIDTLGRPQTPPPSPQPSRSYTFTVIPIGTFFDFAANGSKLTGSIIRGETEKPILDGKISGNRITFTVRETIGGRTHSYSYAGELSNDRIRFDVRPPRNGGARFQFTARRL